MRGDPTSEQSEDIIFALANISSVEDGSHPPQADIIAAAGCPYQIVPVRVISSPLKFSTSVPS